MLANILWALSISPNPCVNVSFSSVLFSLFHALALSLSRSQCNAMLMDYFDGAWYGRSVFPYFHVTCTPKCKRSKIRTEFSQSSIAFQRSAFGVRLEGGKVWVDGFLSQRCVCGIVFSGAENLATTNPDKQKRDEITCNKTIWCQIQNSLSVSVCVCCPQKLNNAFCHSGRSLIHSLVLLP